MISRLHKVSHGPNFSHVYINIMEGKEESLDDCGGWLNRGSHTSILEFSFCVALQTEENTDVFTHGPIRMSGVSL